MPQVTTAALIALLQAHDPTGDRVVFVRHFFGTVDGEDVALRNAELVAVAATLHDAHQTTDGDRRVLRLEFTTD